MSETDVVEEQKLIIEEQRRTLDLSLSSAHLLLELVADLQRVLLRPLADLDVTTMDDDDMRIVVEESKKASKSMLDRIEFALTTHADINTGA